MDAQSITSRLLSVPDSPSILAAQRRHPFIRSPLLNGTLATGPSVSSIIRNFRPLSKPTSDEHRTGVALLAPTTSSEDVFFGFYSWLSKHPTETVFIFMKYESGPLRENNEAIQKKLYDIFNSKLGKRFWLQSLGHLRTLGQARGKMILLQRTPYDKLSLPLHQIGIPLPPNLWLDNDANILFPYNPTRLSNNTAHIENFYQSPQTTVSLQANVDAKVDAALQYLQLAIGRSGETKRDEHFWITFANATQVDYSAIAPRIMALREGSVKGVDQQF